MSKESKTTLIFNYSDVSFDHACSYYTVVNNQDKGIDLTKLKSLKITNKNTDGYTSGIKNVVGSISGDGAWEFEVNKTYDCSYTNHISNVTCWNETVGEGKNQSVVEKCKDNGYDEFVPKTCWKLEYVEKAAFKSVIGIGETQKIRYCADISRVRTDEGWTIKVDHIPEFDGISYEQYAWWNSSWGACRNITIDSGNIDSDLTNFPLMVLVNSSRIDYAKTQNAGQDIRFATGTCDNAGSELKHEIEKWNESGNSFMWVKVPSVSSSSNTTIAMYYDNAGASDGQNATGLWTDYGAVWLMTEINITDSTTNENNGTEYGDITLQPIGGKIGSPAVGSGTTNDYIEVPDDDSIDFAGNLTLEMWLKYPEQDGYNRVLSNAPNWGSTMQIKVDDPNNRLFFIRGNTVNAEWTGTSTITTEDDNWHHIVCIDDGSGFRIYVDKGIGYSGTPTGYATAVTTSELLTIFGRGVYNDLRLDSAAIDLLRIAPLARSYAWANATYESETDDLLTFGAEESDAVEDTTSPTYSTNATNATLAGTPCNFTLSWNDETALETNGEYIFSTNNSGTWANSSATNFTATPQTSWNVTTLNSTVGAVIQWKYYGTDNEGNWNTSGTYSLTTTDGTAPTWRDNTISISSPATYSFGADYGFQINFTDETAMDNVTFSENQSGSWTNHTDITNVSIDIYYYNMTDLPVGTFSYRFYGYDTTGNINETDTWSYTINKAKPILTISNSTDSVNTSGLVGYWRFSSVNATNYTLDSSGYDNDGLLTNFPNAPAQTSSGRLGTGLEFDGVDDCVVLSTNETFNISSLSMWFKSNNLASYNSIAGNTYTGLYQGYIAVSSNAFVVESDTNGDQIRWDGLPFYNNVWHHVLLVQNSTNITLWVNGINKGTKPRLSNPLHIDHIGKGYVSSRFSGTIDEVMIYNRALSGDEIRLLYNSNSEYGTATNAAGTEANSGDDDVTYLLYLNTTSINTPDSTTRASGHYYYVYNGTGGANWTKSEIVIPYQILGGILTGSLSGSNVTYPASVNVQPSETNTGDDDVNYTFWRDTTLISSAIGSAPTADTSQLAAGSYDYVLNSTGGANYTTNDSIAAMYVVVSQASSSCSLTSSNTFSYTYNDSTTLICTCTGDGTAHLYFDGVEHDGYNDTSTVFGANVTGWNVTCNTTAGTNYTSAQNSSSLAIAKAITTGSLTNTTGWTVTYPTEVTIGLSESNAGDGGCTYNVYRNTTDVTPGETVTLGADTYTYILNTTGCANYSANASIDTQNLIVNKGPTTTELLIDGTSADASYYVTDSVNFTVTVNISGETVNLDTNLTGWVLDSGTTPLYNTTTMTDEGYFNITGYYSGDANHSSSSDTQYVNVTIASTPSVSNINWITTGGFSDSTLTYNQIIDYVNVTVTDDLSINVYLNVYDPDGTLVVNNQSMSNYTADDYSYTTDFTLNKAGSWTFNISASNVYNTQNASSTITVSIQSQSIRDGWYGHTDETIMSSARITELSAYGYDIFELETATSVLSSSWGDMKNAINDSREANIRVGLNYLLDFNYTNTTAKNEVLTDITNNFPDLTSTPYTDAMEYISFELVDAGSYSDAEKYGILNDIAENTTSAISNDYVIFSKNYNHSSLDGSYIEYTNLLYLDPSSEADFINLQRDYFGNTTSLNRIYINASMKDTIKTFHETVMDNLRSTPVTTDLGEENATALSNNDVIIFNNGSSSATYAINVSELSGESGKDAWDSTHGYLIEENTDLNFSVDVDGYNGTIIYFEDLDHIQLDSLTSSNVYTGAASSTEKFNYTNGTLTNNFGLYGANDIQIELFDPHYDKNNFIVYYGWLNSSFIKSPEGWNDYEVVIIADENNAEIDSLNFTATEFYVYISVADYDNGNQESWFSNKTDEVDDWLALNDSLHIFVNGLDSGIAGANFSSRMKDLVDYVQVTKGRKAMLNTYTVYEEFATWGDGGVMKESCVNRWNGASAANPDNYTRETWSLEIEKSDWYHNHNIKVFCMAFDNRSTYGDYTLLNYTEVQNIYFASKVLGYEYFYLSQPDFNYAHLEYVYDTGSDLDRTYHQMASDANTYYRTYENGIVYYNTTSEQGWIDDGRIINSADVCFYLYDPHANNVEFRFNVNNRNPTGSSSDYAISDGWGVGTWSWECKEITTPPTNGRYLIEGWCDDHTPTPGQGLNIGYQDYGDANTGKHSWYDTSSTDSWTIYQMDRNWMVNISVNETKKTTIDTTTDIVQTEANTSGHTNVTLTGTHSCTIDVWSYPTSISNFVNLKYLNSTDDWVTMNYVNNTDCDSDNPTWNTTSIEGETYKACIEPDGSDTIVRVVAPSLSAKIFRILSNNAPTSGNLEEVPTDPATYSHGQTYKFNVTIDDDEGASDIDTVLFSWNSSANVTVTTNTTVNSTALEFQYTLPNDLAVQSATSYSWYANDSQNEWTSISGTYTVNTAPLQGSISGSNVTYPTAVDIIPTETNVGDGDVNYTFWRNSSLVSSAIGSAPSADTTQLAAGSYTYILNSTGGANYSSNSSIDSRYIVVSQAPTSTTLYLNGSATNTTYEYGATINMTGSVNTSYGTTIYLDMNETGYGNNFQSDTDSTVENLTDSSLINQTVFNVTAHFDGDTNYTSSSATLFVYFLNETLVSINALDAQVVVGSNLSAYYNFSIFNPGTESFNGSISVLDLMDTFWFNTTPSDIEVNVSPSETIHETVNLTNITVTETTWSFGYDVIDNYNRYAHSSSIYVWEENVTPTLPVLYTISSARLTLFDERTSELDATSVDAISTGVTQSGSSVTIGTTHNGSESLPLGTHPVVMTYYVPDWIIGGGGGGGGGGVPTTPGITYKFPTVNETLTAEEIEELIAEDVNYTNPAGETLGQGPTITGSAVSSSGGVAYGLGRIVRYLLLVGVLLYLVADEKMTVAIKRKVSDLDIEQRFWILKEKAKILKEKAKRKMQGEEIGA